MVEPMEIDQDGVSGQVTPAESYTESSLKREDTPESTEDGSTHMTAREKDLQRRALESSARKREYQDKHSKLDRAKLTDSAKRFAFLLGQTELFRHFINIRADQDAEFKQLLDESKKVNMSRSSSRAKITDHRHRKTEQEEDAELLQDEEDEEDERTLFRESPAYVKGGEMRDYQVQGLNWLISLYENGINGILADEMGLGKTLQTISFLGYLRFLRGVNGPHLIAVPKSTINNWAREFAHWIPEIKVLVFQGAKEERQELVRDRLLTQDFDVCVTSYEMVLREKAHFKKFAWEYIIIDEAHRIKNEESMLSQIVRLFNSRNRLLITGTPLQNNLHELWALLNFLLPDVFSDSAAFDQWFQQQNADQDAVVQQLHKVLRPFLLRRVKSDVEKALKPKKELNIYVGMSEMQVKWYRRILEKDIDAVNGAVGKREGKTRLLNIVMQLRKCCNHPYLFDGAEPGPPYTNDEHIVFNSGKMVILDKLLKRMKAQGSRVLIFSQMSRVLDILEDYCVMREYKYCRIDGSTAHDDRITAIDDYNREGSEKFIFLLTTRAGGLGINLTTADIVVLYDSDWNPQADLQAMDRAHRIGQTKQVFVYRFVTENAIEEKVLERAAQKLRLDQLVIQQGRAQQASTKVASKDELLTMVQHGAEEIFEAEGGTIGDNDIDDIFRHGEERTKKLQERYAELGLDDLQNFTSESAYNWMGEDFKQKKQVGLAWINPSKRERHTPNYSIDHYYKDALHTGGPTQTKPKAPRPPKQINIQDHQFYPPELKDLHDRETLYFRKEQGYKVPLPEGDDLDAEEREQQRAEEQQEIDDAVPLTEEEIQEKEELSTQGFGNWQRRDFHHFVRANERYGRDKYAEIAEEIGTKTAKEVKEYSKVFWERYEEIEGYDRYVTAIEAGEERIRKQERQSKFLHEKLSQYRAPLLQLQIQYNQNKGKVYTEEEDRFMLVQLDKFGVGNEDIYERIREEIRESPLFRFDWFFLSRTSLEIQRRCTTLLTMIMREYGEEKRGLEEDDSRESTPAMKKGRKAGNKIVESLKNKQSASVKGSKQTSRASSVGSSVSTNVTSGKKGQKRKR